MVAAGADDDDNGGGDEHVLLQERKGKETSQLLFLFAVCDRAKRRRTKSLQSQQVMTAKEQRERVSPAVIRTESGRHVFVILSVDAVS